MNIRKRRERERKKRRKKEFHEHLSDYELLKTDSVTWISCN
jgi:hypothetical protein